MAIVQLRPWNTDKFPSRELLVNGIVIPDVMRVTHNASGGSSDTVTIEIHCDKYEALLYSQEGAEDEEG